MLTKPQPPRIHLPKGWQDCVKLAVLHAIAPAHYAIVYARAWAADSINARVRLAAENDQLNERCALLREELRIKDIRMAQIALHYGADDIDGTVVEEHITHDAGATTPQGLTTERLAELIRETGRQPVLRDTLYEELVAF